MFRYNSKYKMKNKDIYERGRNMSVNKEYMSLYREFFDGVDMEGVLDLSEEDKEYKALDFGEAILAINESLQPRKILP